MKLISNEGHGIKKYELTENTKKWLGTTLYQIKALCDFTTVDGKQVRKGELGGWIESENNLSQDENCWVADEAMVCEDAQISGDVKIYGQAKVYGNAQVYGKARISDNAEVYEKAEIYYYADVYGDAQVYGQAKICGRAMVHEHAQVYGRAKVCGNVQVYGNAWVYGNAKVSGFARVYGNARVTYEIESGKVFLRPSDPGMSTAEYIPAPEYFSVAALMTPIDRFEGSFHRGGDFFPID